MSENDEKNNKFVIDRFEGSSAVLVDEKTEIIVPKKLIPKKLEEGDVVHLTLSSDKAETLKREKSAKKLLNEILSAKG